MRYVEITNNYVTKYTDDAAPNGWVPADNNVGTGFYYDGSKFYPEKPANPTEWFIDLGPFFDRFGTAMLPVLTSPDPTVKAIITQVLVRKWIDLKRADVASSLAYIATVVPSLTSTIINHILNTPVSEEENLALRKSFFHDNSVL